MNTIYLKDRSQLLLILSLMYALNCSDALFTYSLLKTRDFYELNPLMQCIINIPILVLLIKVFIPALILIYIFNILLDSYYSIPTIIKLLALSTLLIYALLNIYHLYLIFML